MRFQTLACTVHKIWHASDLNQILFEGAQHKEDNWSKKKNVRRIFFEEESIYSQTSIAGTPLGR